MPDPLTRTRTLLATLVAVVGCHAGNGAAPVSPSGGGFTVSERAETGPITALAIKPPYLWAGGAPGLRRFDVAAGDWETVGEPNDTRTRAVTAIAIDDDGAAWVAGAMGIGRWVAAGDDLRYESKGTPGTVHALAARRPVATEGIWAGGPGGLYHYDGRIFPSVDGVREVPVSVIALDDDGKGAWVGTHKHGVYHAAGDHGAPVEGGEGIFVDTVLGFAKTAAGTRLMAGNAANEARLYALTKAGVEGFHAQPGPVVVALVERGGDAALIAGPPGKPQVYTLRPLAPNEAFPPGSLRFASLVSERSSRWAAVPTADKLPPDVTLAASAGGELYVGTARLGVARATPDGPRPLAGSQLVGDAQRLFVACASRVRCFVVTDGPRAWLTDGATYQTTRLGEPEAATPLALATDAQGTVYAVAREADAPGLVITRLAAGVRAPVETDWHPLHKIALELPAKATPTISFAAVSGANTLWLGAARDRRRWGRHRLRRRRDRAGQRPCRPAPAAQARRESPRRGAAAAVQPDLGSCSIAARPITRRCPASAAGRKASCEPGTRTKACRASRCTRSRAAATARSGPRRPRAWRASMARTGGRWGPPGWRRTGWRRTAPGACGSPPTRGCGCCRRMRPPAPTPIAPR
jgi:hypothetical protein